MTHQREKETYQEKHSLKVDMEKTGPKLVRELSSVKIARLDAEENGLCEHGCGMDETIKRTLCNCVANIMEACARNGEEPVTYL